MREIKFRIWDGKEYHYSDGMTYIGLEKKSEIFQLFSKLAFTFSIPISNKNTDSCAIQQFTGLKDIKGKDIYEGDIVKVRFLNEKPFNGEVYYDESAGQFLHTFLKGRPGKAMWQFAEVVGNIFE
jgi:uncharacterized phage protein (TIGR01671 family)